MQPATPSTIIPTHPECPTCEADMDVGMIAPSVFSHGRGPVTYVCLACGSVAKRHFPDALLSASQAAA